MPDPRFFNDIEGAPWSDVAPAVKIVPPGTFEKPGVQKLALIVREAPGG